MSFEDKLSELLASLHGDEQTKARLDMNKFFQERIETIRIRLWTTLTWLAAVQGAALPITIKEGGLRAGTGSELLLGQPILIILLSLLAAMLAYYMRRIADDGVEHIRSNQRLSSIAVGLVPGCGTESVFNVMRRLATVSMLVDVAIALVGVLGLLDWLGLDIPGLRIAPATEGGGRV